MRPFPRLLVGSDIRQLQVTPFIGREMELTEIASRLTEPGCRLLTLLGVGGSGKTRLAREIMEHKRGDFRDGVYFVPLVAAQTADHLVTAIADTLALSFYNHVDPQQQLLSDLAEKHMLLILDNFEQLVASAWLVSKILQTSPEVHIIITSRQALNLREEWRWNMLGMNFPTGSASEPIEAYDAVQQFTERARRFRNDFSLANEMVGVKRICQLTEGMPLALELAAAWVHVLSCEQIADEIQRGVEFLSTSISDMPEQHGSMHSIFERTWDMLTPQQCTTFMKLSVFRGGFTYEAARDIAEASPVLLAELSDKALIRKARADHYDIHELLRQYADAHLQSAGAAPRVQAAHYHYYAEFLYKQVSGAPRSAYL